MRLLLIFISSFLASGLAVPHLRPKNFVRKLFGVSNVDVGTPPLVLYVSNPINGPVHPSDALDKHGHVHAEHSKMDHFHHIPSHNDKHDLPLGLNVGDHIHSSDVLEKHGHTAFNPFKHGLNRGDRVHPSDALYKHGHIHTEHSNRDHIHHRPNEWMGLYVDEQRFNKRPQIGMISDPHMVAHMHPAKSTDESLSAAAMSASSSSSSAWKHHEDDFVGHNAPYGSHTSFTEEHSAANSHSWSANQNQGHYG